MKISIKVKTKSKIEKVKKTGDGCFAVFTNSTPEKGKANKAVIKLLSKHFKTPAADIKIINGLTSKNKIVEIGF
jgi:hypothetical protein